jgi:hypothetical protein
MIEGVPKVDYRFMDRANGWQYNPVTVSQYALCLYDEYITEKANHKKELFFKQVKWLENNIEKRTEDIFALPYNFPHKWCDLSAPWYSGMAQGQAASVFIRAYALTQDNKYKRMSANLINFMLLSVEKGGALTKTPEGLPWIEECVTEKPSLILNGHLYGLLGLIEYYLYMEDEKYKSSYDELIQATLELIPSYEKDNCLIYARRININKCSPKYMGLQALEAKHVYELTKNTDFKEIYERWYSYTDWKKFWEDIDRQNRRIYYIVKNIKGFIKSLFPRLYTKIRLSV